MLISIAVAGRACAGELPLKLSVSKPPVQSIVCMSDDKNIIDQFFEHHQPRLSEKTVTSLRPLLSVWHLPKKHVLVRENQLSKKIYLIQKGASRSFYLHKGIEVHTWFAFEGEVVGSLRNFNNLPSRESIALLEDSILIAFDIPGIRDLMERQVEVSKFVNTTMLEYALFLEDRLFDLHLKSAREKFNVLLKHEAKIFQRVPLTYIASYLGISRETLSRLRSS